MATITAKIIGSRSDINGVSDLYIEAWVLNSLQAYFLGSSKTTANGSFEIAYEDTDIKPASERSERKIYFKIYRNGILLDTTEEQPVALNLRSIPDIPLEAKTTGRIFTSVYRGLVATPQGRGLQNITVRAFNTSARQDTWLSETRTNSKGEYFIYYPQPIIGRDEVPPVDLVVKAYENNTSDTPIITSPLFINALQEEVINLSVGDEEYRGLDTYTRLLETMEGSLAGLDIIDLSARDVLILANSHSLVPEDVAFYIEAQQWLALWDGLPAEVYFAWFKVGLSNNWTDILNTPTEQLQMALDSAVEENFVPESTVNERLDLEAKISLWRTDNLIMAKGERVERASVGELLANSRLDEEQRRGVLEDWQTFDGSVDEFWQKQECDLGADNYRDLEFTLQLGALTRNHLPLINAVKSQTNISRVQDIANLEIADWLALLQNGSMEVPDEITGETVEIQRLDFATQLRATTEELLPTVVLARAFRNDSTVDSNVLDRFMESNPEFEFRGTTVRKYLKENPDALADLDDRDAAQKELEAVQRIFHLTPSREKYSAAKVLWENQLHSAYAIKMAGRESLKALFKDEFELAENIFYKADMRHNRTKLVKMQLQSVASSFNVVSPSISTVLNGMDDAADLEALFGDQGYCACKHCDSFFSPSAYLTDIFLFLNKAKVSASNPAPDEDTVLERLFKRRADLGNIELDCENSHTPLPYIDLVNEILEMAIVPHVYQNTQVTILGKNYTLPVASVPQTESDASMLRAYPQSLKQEAYNLLMGDENNQGPGFPWNLPFNLWLLEVRTYLEHLGVPRADLMASILGGNQSAEHIALEYLNFLPEEQAIINDHTGNKDTTHKYWNSTLTLLKQVPVFLKQSGYSYKELTTILQLQSIQPTQTIVFDPPSSCSVSNATIPGLTNTVLNRIHKLGRLKLKTGESFYDLDRSITALGGNVDDTFIVSYTDLKRIEQRIKKKIDRREILSWWSTIDRKDYENSTSLYSHLFMQPEKLMAFNLNANGDELENLGIVVDPKQPLQYSEDIFAVILSVTRLNADDLELLIAELPGQVITLSLQQISYLYRTASFCRAMKLSISAYLTLKKLFGFQPISGISQQVNPASTLAFINKYECLKNADVEPELLDYLLRHHVRSNAPYAISDQEISLSLKSVRQKIVSRLHENAVTDTTVRNSVEAKLKLLLGAAGDEGNSNVIEIMAVLVGSSALSQQAQEALIDEALFFVRNKADAHVQLLGGSSTVETRFEYMLSVVDRYLVENTIVSELSVTLALPVDTTEYLLKELLAHPSIDEQNAVDVFFDESFLNIDAQLDWDQLVLPDQFTTLIRLHKISLLYSLFDLSLDDLIFLMKHGGNADLPNINLLPVVLQETADEVEKWINLVQLVNIGKAKFRGKTSIFNILEMAQDGASTLDQIFEHLSLSTQWKKSDLSYLTAPTVLNLSFPQDYHNGNWLVKVAEALGYVNRAGATAMQMTDWTAATITKAHADAVRNAAKAKYGDEQWQEVTVPLRNNIRERQRDALVQYVLHYTSKYDGTSFEDIEDIYAYYLIDTQMAACADTSRIVLAASSVQLFVQRIMMNLEPSMFLSAEFTKEWKWRKYYRVWEANRKVFMWPENWIEPELRDDKTPQFKELENELLQGELNTEIVERAYVNYLEKLHGISNLRVCGVHQEGTNFHVIAHTKGIPQAYYYRRWESRFQWTPWEKIELDIFNGEEIDAGKKGTLLVPVVHNRRLFIFWPVFTLEKRPTTSAEEGEINSLKNDNDKKKSKIRLKQGEVDQKIKEINSLEDKKKTFEKIGDKWFLVELADEIIDELEDDIWQLVLEIYGEDESSGLTSEIEKLESGIRENEEKIRQLEQGHMRYKISMAWSQYRDGIWTPKTTSERSINTPLFRANFSNGSKISHYIVSTDSSPELNFKITFTDNKKAYCFTHSFQYDDARSQLDIDRPTGFASLIKYKEISGFEKTIEYMKSYTKNQALSIISGKGEQILLLNNTSNNGKVVRSFKKNIFKNYDSFFYEDAEHSFFISTPSIFNIRDKSRPFAKNSALKMGTDTLQSSIVDPSIAVISELGESSGRTFSATDASQTALVGEFFGQSDSTEVIVRPNSQSSTISSLSVDKVRFGRRPSQVTNKLDYVRSKMDISVNGYGFSPFYHPYSTLFLKEINKYGIDGLLDPNLRLGEGAELLHQKTPSQKDFKYFVDKYKPHFSEVVWSSVKEEIDFNHGGAYATYNWELFYHIPLYIATRLTQDQRFDEAQSWFHYIFNPTEAEGDAPYRYWKIKPFHTYSSDEIKNDIEAVLNGGEAIKKQVQAWEKNPFNPHLLARFRKLAYMKTVVMKYLDNLIAWGDQLYRRDSIESLNEAVQLYVLAGQILGKLPVETEAKPRSAKSFNELASNLTALGNAWVNLENIIADEDEDTVIDTDVDSKEYFQSNKVRSIQGARVKSVQGKVGSGVLDDILYFCISPNEKMLSYWDTISDRLFKLRNCMDIEGIVRSVPLFQPPIDPALLVKATAAGVDISSAINNLYAPMPHYRFNVLLQKATNLCQDLKSFGSTLLSAIQNKEGDQLSLMRTSHEIKLLEASKDIRKAQIEEARLAEAGLVESQKLANIRLSNYSERQYMNVGEGVAMELSAGATLFQFAAGQIASAASVAAMWPDKTLSFHAQGFASGTSTTIYPPGSGEKTKESALSISKVFDVLASTSREGANIISTLSNYGRREDDWNLQIELAEQEIVQIEKQILAATIRREIVVKEQENLNLQIENSKQINDYMTNKYSNQELYNWMCGQISAVYFQTYKMAYDLAKQAERAFQFELGIENSSYIEFGYWDNMRKGLMSGEKLLHDLKRLDLAYIEKNKRDFEITKHLPLSFINSVELLKLKETGACEFSIPELLFDLDFPGQYFRRIKSVSVTIPCVVGPYTSVPAKLTLIKNRIRKNGNSQTAYAYTGLEDPNFVHELVGIQSVATSTAQNDSGLFQLDFRDERYLPFEGAGAVSTWRLELPTEFRSFDYDTISDVILHMNYTARDGGDALKQTVNTHVNESINKWLDELAEEGDGLLRVLSMKQDFPNAWHRFFNTLPTNGLSNENSHQLNIEVTPQHFPYFLNGRELEIYEVQVGLKLTNDDDSDLVVGIPVMLTKDANSSIENDDGFKVSSIQNLPFSLFSNLIEDPVGLWSVSINSSDIPASLLNNDLAIDKEKIEDMYFVMKYKILK